MATARKSPALRSQGLEKIEKLRVIEAKFDWRQEAKVIRVQDSAIQAAHTINRDMRNELRNLNQNINLEHCDLTKLHHSVQELVVIKKNYTAMHETLISCFTGQMRGISQAISKLLKHFSNHCASTSDTDNHHVMPIPFVPLLAPLTRNLGLCHKQRIALWTWSDEASAEPEIRTKRPPRYNQHRSYQ